MAFKRYAHVKNTLDQYPHVEITERETDLYMEYGTENKLELIAYQVYGDPGLWWIIMLANPEYTMEYEIEPGETLRIPLPLNSVITEIKNQVS
jgi:hypothetical protein